MLDSIFTMLPRKLRSILQYIPSNIQLQLEEVRVREGRPLEVNYLGKYGYVTENSSITENPQFGYRPTQEDCLQFLDLLANHSLYTLEEELKRGYITIRGGHRVGLAGRTVLEGGQVKQLREISSFNIRVAREMMNSASSLLPYITDGAAEHIHNTLIVSPPQQGKTTIARDLARLISYGYWQGDASKWRGLKVGIVDERSELAACEQGVPVFDVGPRTDVLDSCPKAEGMMMLIRSMSPDVIVVDEIGREEDARAIHEALHAGIRIIATAHGGSLDDVKIRPNMKGLLTEGIFSRYVILHRIYRQGTVAEVLDRDGLRTGSITMKQASSQSC